MSNIKSFFPAFIGLIIFGASYFMESLISANVEADKELSSKIAMLIENQNIEPEASKLLYGSVNSLLENNHALLFQTVDIVWAIGLGIILLLFPYHSVFCSRK
ncbi:hypothetical protein [Thalassotalea sp. G2M2-11]|uniref:hypothetical protein n=1 Tax=Thalassotalea sp. G2M2-11 TaxID=2787627 RepID=UPI0019D06223|nr:hypothetical protein [Thalassotalea sp. G2M2-11]